MRHSGYIRARSGGASETQRDATVQLLSEERGELMYFLFKLPAALLT